MGKIAVVIPCYDVAKHCEAVIEKALLYTTWVILVDDGSTDGTNAILRKMEQRHPDRIHLIVFPHNRGKGVALMEGIHYALTSTSFEILITLDSDGQHLPADMDLLVAKVKEGNDFVIGCRQFDQMPFRRRFANTLISFLLRKIFPNAPLDTQSGFRAMGRALAQKIKEQVTGERYEMEFRCLLLALQGGYKIASCPIHTFYFDSKHSSHFSILKDSWRILKVLFHYWKSKAI